MMMSGALGKESRIMAGAGGSKAVWSEQSTIS